MSKRADERWQNSMSELAAGFAYPETPDVTATVIQRLRHGRPARRSVRRLAWAAVFLLLLVASLWAVPTVRAAVQQFLQIGAVRLQVVEPTVSPTAVPVPSPSPPQWDLGLTGETTLAAARDEVDFDLRLPAYPPDLGPPDHVYVQDLGDAMVILIWLAQTEEQSVRMSLTVFGPGTFVEKMFATHTQIEETTVNGVRALWMEGEHLLRFEDEGFQPAQLVAGDVLVWTEETPQGQTITYRLESGLSMAEALQVAESLR